MKTWEVALANFGTSMGSERFNSLEFSPDQPDEIGLREKGGATAPRGKTPLIPDEPDVLDAEPVLDGLGAAGLRRVRRVRRVDCGFLVVSGEGAFGCGRRIGGLVIRDR